MRHAAVVIYRDRDRQYLDVVLRYCREAGIEAEVGLPSDVVPDLVVILGGDGTVLQYIHDVVFRGLERYLEVPVLHIGTGKVNFLSDLDVQELTQEVFLKLASGTYTLDERVMLEVAVGDTRVPVLNEVLFRYVNPGKITTFTVEETEGEVIMSGRMDGVIVSTPTGSTAYILALGGPVVDYRVSNIKIIIPVAPFSPALVPVVHPLDIEIVIRSEGYAHVVCDGIVYGTHQSIRVRKCEKTFKFVRTRPYSFYAKLAKRLFTP